MLKSNWFMSFFAEGPIDESDLATHLSLVCNALLLLHEVVRSADVLCQLCPLASCKSTSFLLLISHIGPGTSSLLLHVVSFILIIY